jgi:DNA-binding CsgD family transcriptional regulator
MSGDFIGVVEAAYDLTGDDRDWLRGIATAATPLLDRGTGVTAFAFDFSGRFASPLAAGPVTTGPEGALRGTVEALQSAPPGAMEHMCCARPGLYQTRSRLPARVRDTFMEQIAAIGRKHGLPPHLSSELMTASEPSGAGVALIVMGLDAAERPASERAPWTPAAVHIATALRLRQAQRRGRTEEAILRPDGRCEHAELPAQSAASRESLRAAVRAIDKARGRAGRRNQEEALADWKGLCSGRWSLVDRFESDGRRFVVAHRNEPDVRDPRALTPREKQVATHAALGYSNKLIAYALGLSSSTVGLHLSRANRKLGVSSRAELVRLVAGFGTQAR